MAESKNFVYGDIWKDYPLTASDDDSGSFKADPAKFTSNTAFINFLKESGYDFYLDYDFKGYARTNVTQKYIVINANYSDQMIGSLLQHELGHLMLFNVNQFVTVGDQTLRSVIAKVIYTPDNLVRCGMPQLLKAENIIQDIIIETVSNKNCVCHNGLSLYGTNMGVKHLDRLESAEHIAKEVCKNILKPKEEVQAPEPLPEELEALLKSMLEGLSADIKEILEELQKVKKSTEYHNNVTLRRYKEEIKKKEQLRKLERRVDAGKDPSGRLSEIVEQLKKDLEDITSKQRVAADNAKADEARNKDLEKLEKKLAKAQELNKLLESARNENLEALEQKQEGKADSNIQSNLTDHLTGDMEDNPEVEGEVSHSYDCGLPMPVTVDRSASKVNERNLVTMNTKPKGKRIMLNEDDADNVLSNRVKIAESEYTYFKSNKRELDQTDMLKGKRKLRVSGINVLIGLDISGSMVNEWSNMFLELSEMISRLQENLDIENIVYFTYDHQLGQQSYDIDDLTLKARGGNAFGYVYQQMMKELPIMQKNEIILVTDCGDNLGFKLEDSCIVERNGIRVVNHVSVIDTENAGFYDIGDMDTDSWSLHRHDDSDLEDAIKANIERLIEG